MCGVIMFTAIGTGWSENEAKQAAAGAVLKKNATGAEEDCWVADTNSTIPEM
jgi:hypothetical protein